MKKALETRADIEQLVLAFYSKALNDPVLKPVFDAANLDLAHHAPVIADFWETTLLDARTYTRNAMQPHLDLQRTIPFTAAHFERWLALWEQTVDAHFEGLVANNAKVRARSIATVMQIKIVQQ